VVDPRLFETWTRLLASMRASAETIETLLPFTPGLNREQLASMLARASTAAPGSGSRPPGAESVEQFWNMLGLVPRYRYDELEERYEALRSRLEEAEVTIQRLRRLMDERGGEPEARQVLDSWASAVGETLRMQAGMVRSMSGLEAPEKGSSQRADAGEKGAAARRPRSRRPRSKP
jgi:hypothetical protein